MLWPEGRARHSVSCKYSCVLRRDDAQSRFVYSDLLSVKSVQRHLEALSGIGTWVLATLKIRQLKNRKQSSLGEGDKVVRRSLDRRIPEKRDDGGTVCHAHDIQRLQTYEPKIGGNRGFAAAAAASPTAIVTNDPRGM